MPEEVYCCCCCQAKAKYEIAGDFGCGRHLAYIVESHCRMGPCTATVSIIEQEKEPE